MLYLMIRTGYYEGSDHCQKKYLMLTGGAAYVNV